MPRASNTNELMVACVGTTDKPQSTGIFSFFFLLCVRYFSFFRFLISIDSVKKDPISTSSYYAHVLEV